MTIKPRKTLSLTATLRPGDFPLGSLESRVTARMKLEKTIRTQRRETIVFHVPRPHRDPMRYHFMGWSGDRETGFMRVVFAPSKWLNPADPVPVCPDCGKPFKKNQEVLGKISYFGDCLEVHDPDRATPARSSGL